LVCSLNEGEYPFTLKIIRLLNIKNGRLVFWIFAAQNVHTLNPDFLKQKANHTEE